jgi:acyl-CoA oxidase
MFAEHAVILANLIIPTANEKERNKGPHLFFTRIQNKDPITGDMTPINDHVKLRSLPKKTALLGLDNAAIEFNNFEVQRTDLLSRFSNVEEDGTYVLNLPHGNKRMLDLLLSRLLTGRVCLSEYTIGMARVHFSSSFLPLVI